MHSIRASAICLEGTFSFFIKILASSLLFLLSSLLSFSFLLLISRAIALFSLLSFSISSATFHHSLSWFSHPPLLTMHQYTPRTIWIRCKRNTFDVLGTEEEEEEDEEDETFVVVDDKGEMPCFAAVDESISLPFLSNRPCFGRTFGRNRSPVRMLMSSSFTNCGRDSPSSSSNSVHSLNSPSIKFVNLSCKTGSPSETTLLFVNAVTRAGGATFIGGCKRGEAKIGQEKRTVWLSGSNGGGGGGWDIEKGPLDEMLCIATDGDTRCWRGDRDEAEECSSEEEEESVEWLLFAFLLRDRFLWVGEIDEERCAFPKVVEEDVDDDDVEEDIVFIRSFSCSNS